MQRKIYLDYNATAPMLPTVKEAIIEVMGPPINPSSIHSYGRNAKKLLDVARQRVANLAGANGYEVIFTASGTESNNIALKGFPEYQVVTTTAEHSSVHQVIGEGIIPVDSNGVIQLSALEQILSVAQGKVLVSVHYANNETGVIQPIKEVVEVAHKYGAIVHTDATQAFGKVPFNAEELDVDLITISGHKFGGPVGAAALIFKKQLSLKPLMQGGGQEHRFRPGTQDVASIHGFGIASEIVAQSLCEYQEIEELRDYLEAKLRKFNKDVIIFGENAKRLPNTSSFTMPGVSNETQVIHFDINGIALSAGSACSSGRVDVPRVHMAMGYDEKVAGSAIRVSLGLDSTKAEIDEFIKLWKQLYSNSHELEKAA